MIKLESISFSLDEQLIIDFKKAIFKKKGYKKGNMKIAIEEAIRDWIKKE